MRRLISHLIPLCGALSLVLLPRLAAAQQIQECSDTKPCADGFECTTGTTPCAEPAIACAPDTECPPPPACDAQPYAVCTPKSCDPEGAADQCGATMVCHTYESGGCSSSGGTAPACAGPDCPATDPAVPPPMEVCTTTTVGQCDYKYNLPCMADADCGDGFTCETMEIGCACAGGSTGTGMAVPGSAGSSDPAPTPPSMDLIAPLPPEMSADAGAAPVDPTCDCPTSTQTYCKVIEVTCDTDADCSDGWTCVDPNPVGCATTVSSPTIQPDMGAPAGTGGASSSGDTPPPAGAEAPSAGGGSSGDKVAPAVDGGATDMPSYTCPEPDPSTVVKKCMPPSYAADYGGVFAQDSAASGVPITPGQGTTGTTTSAENGATPPAPGGANDPSSNMSTTAGNGATGSSDSSGCSLAASTSSSSNAGLVGLMLGLAALVSRRRR